MLLTSPAPIHKLLGRLLKSLCASRPYSVIKGIAPAGRQPGIGFVLAALLSMFLVLAAQAQTDTSGGTSSTVPTLTIAASSATATEGDEITYTITAGSAPSSALPVVVHVRAHGEVMDTRTVAEVFLPAGATTVTLRLEEFTDEIDESPVNVTLTLAGGTGYSVGDPSEATVSIDYPSDSGTQATSAPTPTPAVSPPDAPSGVSISAPTINSFTVSWTAETGKSYRVEREAAFLFKYRVWQVLADDLTTSSYTESGLPCGLYYLFQMQAKVTGSTYGVGAKKIGSAQNCPSTSSDGSRVTRGHVSWPKLRLVTDNPTEDKIQIRLLLHGPREDDEQYTPIPASLGLTDFQVDRSERYVGTGDPVFPTPAIRMWKSVAEFDWTGLECGSSYYFKARGGKKANPSDPNSAIDWGHWSTDPAASPTYVSSMAVHGSTRGCSKLATPDVTVIPMALRKAKLSWGMDSNANTYSVEVREKQTGDMGWSPISTRKTPTASIVEEVNLDQIEVIVTVGSTATKSLAHSPHAFQFRVRAKHATNSSLDSDFAMLTIIDSPITSVNGHSGSTGQASVTWEANSDATKYVLRWRKVFGTHTDAEWQLTNDVGSYSPGDTMDVARSQTSATISGNLDLGAVYAIQLSYETSVGTVFAGRDAFVWPSSSKPGAGQRVAGYPFAGHFASKTYSYKICGEFAGDDANWKALITDAVMEWQTATNGFITINRDIANEMSGCPNYSGQATANLLNFIEYLNIVANDRRHSEIRMVNPPTNVSQLDASLVEMMFADIFKACMMHGKFAACTSSYNEFLPALQGDSRALQASAPLVSSDIVLIQAELTSSSNPPDFPQKPDKTVFNHCTIGDDVFSDEDETQFRAYGTVVHETGHALGLSGFARTDTLKLVVAEIIAAVNQFLPFQIPTSGATADTTEIYQASHPSTPGAVMNYDTITPKVKVPQEPDCAPHPLDVLAIYALYQSPVTP